MSELIISEIEKYVNTPTQSFMASLLSKTGKFGKDLFKKVITQVFQRNIKVDEAVIGFNQGGSIDGYLFHIVDRESITYEAEVTDHYIDTNRPVHDHIAWKPVTIQLRGMQGSYFHDISQDVSKSLMYYRNFNLISSFIPKMPNDVIARKVKSTISNLTGKSGLINEIANKFTSYAFGFMLDKFKELGGNLVEYFDSSVKVEDEQTRMFLYLETVFKVGMPISIYTSWKRYDNMIITSLKPSRDNNGDITEFDITAKQISTVNSIVVNTEEKVCSETTENQNAPVTDKGTTAGQEIIASELGALDFNNNEPIVVIKR